MDTEHARSSQGYRRTLTQDHVQSLLARSPSREEDVHADSLDTDSDLEGNQFDTPPEFPNIPLPIGQALCQQCAGISVEMLVRPTGYVHATSPSMLWNCLSTCELCPRFIPKAFCNEWARIIARPGQERGSLTIHLIRNVDQNNPFPSNVEVRFRGKPLRLLGDLLVRIHDGKNISILQSSGNLSHVLKDDPAAEYGVPIAQKSFDTASTFSFQLVESWLSHCRLHHSCSQPLSFDDPTTGAPRRLLDVELYPSSIKLVQFDQEDKLPSFAALSHCWGPRGLPLDCKTTLATISERESHIPYLSLPKNFRDAIQITRRLDIRYLWIDSLCIIQDSTADWNEEASKMGAIYARSVLTIAAGCGGDAESGCFVQNYPPFRTYVPRQIPNMQQDGRLSTLLVTVRKRIITSRGILQTPLTTRGWTLQEHIMAPRLLHYTDHGLFWECRQDCYSEQGKVDLMSLLSLEGADLHRQTTPSTATLLGIRSSNPDGQWVGVLYWYSRILADYSKRRLTYRSDKLPAVSAIARAVHWQIQSQYLAGIFAWDISFGLSFQRLSSPRDKTPLRPAHPLVPSWTWAAHDFEAQWPVPFRSSMVKPYITLVGSDIEFEGSDPFGRVTRGRLQVSGLVLPVTLSISEGLEPRLIYRAPDGEKLLAEDPKLDYEVDSQPVTLMRLCAAEDCVIPPFSYWIDHYLLLTEIEDGEDEGSFTRIGLLETDHTSRRGTLEGIPLERFHSEFKEKSITLL